MTLSNYNIQEFRYDNKNKILFGLIDNFIGDRAPGKLINVTGKTKIVVFRHLGNEFNSRGALVSYDYIDSEKLGIKLKFITNSYVENDDEYFSSQT